MNEMVSSRRLSELNDRMAQVVNSFDHHMRQPETIEDDRPYDVILIGSPLFDQDGRAVSNLCLGGFSQLLTRKMLMHYANQPMRTCLEIMRANRQPVLSR